MGNQESQAGREQKGYSNMEADAVPQWAPHKQGSSMETSDFKWYNIKDGSGVFAPVSTKNNWHKDSVTSVCWSPDGTLLVSASVDRKVQVWSTYDKETQSEGSNESVSHKKILPDASYVCPDAVLSVSTSIPRRSGPSNQISSDVCDIAAAIADGSVLILGVALTNQEGGMGGYKYLVKKLRKLAARETSRTLSVCWSLNTSYLISGCQDSTILAMDLRPDSNKHLQLIGHARDVTAVAISNDGNMIASCSKDSTVIVWDTPTGNEPLGHNYHLTTLLTASSKKDSNSLRCVAWSPSGCYLAAGGDNGMTFVWELDRNRKKGKLLFKILSDGYVTCLHWNVTSEVLCVGSQTNFKFWNIVDWSKTTQGSVSLMVSVPQQLMSIDWLPQVPHSEFHVLAIASGSQVGVINIPAFPNKFSLPEEKEGYSAPFYTSKQITHDEYVPPSLVSHKGGNDTVIISSTPSSTFENFLREKDRFLAKVTRTPTEITSFKALQWKVGTDLTKAVKSAGDRKAIQLALSLEKRFLNESLSESQMSMGGDNGYHDDDILLISSSSSSFSSSSESPFDTSSPPPPIPTADEFQSQWLNLPVISKPHAIQVPSTVVVSPASLTTVLQTAGVHTIASGVAGNNVKMYCYFYVAKDSCKSFMELLCDTQTRNMTATMKFSFSKAGLNQQVPVNAATQTVCTTLCKALGAQGSRAL